MERTHALHVVPQLGACDAQRQCLGDWVLRVVNQPDWAGFVTAAHPLLVIALDLLQQIHGVVTDLVIDLLVMLAAQQDQVVIDVMARQRAMSWPIGCRRDDVRLLAKDRGVVGLGSLGDQQHAADRAASTGADPENPTSPK